MNLTEEEEKRMWELEDKAVLTTSEENELQALLDKCYGGVE